MCVCALLLVFHSFALVCSALLPAAAAACVRWHIECHKSEGIRKMNCWEFIKMCETQNERYGPPGCQRDYILKL